MVWINDLDSTGCNVFVDGTIKSVSCDFMLPTLCEMDEHVRLTAFPSSVAELSLEVGHYLSTGYQDILFYVHRLQLCYRRSLSLKVL